MQDYRYLFPLGGEIWPKTHKPLEDILGNHGPRNPRMVRGGGRPRGEGGAAGPLILTPGGQRRGQSPRRWGLKGSFCKTHASLRRVLC